jgi:hypothetical protein
MYIDPNTGGLLAGILISLFGLISGVILVFSSKIKMGIAKFRRSLRKDTEDTVPTEPKDE